MGSEIKHQNEAFQKDFNEIYDKGKWTKDDICMMKDLKKLIYYNKVIEAMDEGSEYPGSEYMPDARSYARHRNPMNGRYMSRDMMPGSGMYYPYYDDYSYDGMNMSGRRYYDSEKEKAIHKLHNMMDNNDNAEQKNALKLAIAELERK